MRSEAPEAVVVCHGLWLPGTETLWLRHRLAGAGFRPSLFRYRSVGAGLDENARLLAEHVSTLPERIVHVVGYSLGGVVAISMLHAHSPACVERVVCLAAPLNGSVTARALCEWPGGRRMLGRTGIDLVERGGVGPWAGNPELGVIAGNVGIGLGRLLGALRGPNDGTVAVDETKIRGADRHIVRHVSHTSLLFSPQVADDVAAFLSSGDFCD